MYIENFGKRSYLAIHPLSYGRERHSRFFYLWHASVDCAKAIVFGQPERLIPAYISLRQSLKWPGAEEPKIDGVDYNVGPAGMVGITFNLANGYNIGMWLREADWHELASIVKGLTKANYMSCEDGGDPDLNPRLTATY
jgi:hypothetical protein